MRAFRRIVAHDEAELQAAAQELAEHPAVAVDIEMGQRVERHPGGLQEWIHILALVQLAAGDLSVIVDPLRCSIEPLGPLMAGPSRKVVLGGGQDVALLARAGTPLRHIVDVGEVAYGLFGRREDGMAALARRIFGLSLDKTIRRADWMVRPLNPTLLTYAFRDPELTLMIYEWFQQEYPEAVAHHEREEFEPALPASAPPWLVQAVANPQEAVAAAMAHDFRVPGDEAGLAADMAPILAGASAPRLVNRLLRVAGELRLRDLLPQILPYAGSLSSMLRASAARAIGQSAELEQGEPILLQLQQDPIEDVRKAAIAGLRDLRAAIKPELAEEMPTADVPSLDASTLSALEQLKAQLEQAET